MKTFFSLFSFYKKPPDLLAVEVAANEAKLVDALLARRPVGQRSGLGRASHAQQHVHALIGRTQRQDE